jgi:hypothetical protein
LHDWVDRQLGMVELACRDGRKCKEREAVRSLRLSLFPIFSRYGEGRTYILQSLA